MDISASSGRVAIRPYGADLVNLHRDILDGAGFRYIHHTVFCAG